MHHPHSPAAALRSHLAGLAALLRPGRAASPAVARARVATTRSERYAKQLCSHAHWRATNAEWSPPDGRIDFPGGAGTCRLHAEPEALVLTIEARGQAELTRLQHIITGNIARMGARDGLTVDWEPQAERP